MGVGGQCYAPAPLSPIRRPDTHCTGGWLGPRDGLDRQKILNRFSDRGGGLHRNQKLIPVIMEWK